MERRVLIAIFLSLVVLYVYQALMPKPPAPKTPAPAAATQKSTAPAAPGAQMSTAAPASEPTAAPAGPAPAAVVAEGTERELVLENELVKAVFTNRGGRLKQWLLKSHHDAAGHPVDLVPHDAPSDQPLPFSLRVDEGGLTPRLNSALYRATTSAGATVAFDYEDASGLTAHKEFRLEPHTYLVTFTASVKHGAQELVPYVQWGPGLGDIGATSGGGFFSSGAVSQAPTGIVYNGDTVTRVAAGKMIDGAVQEGTLRFAGVDDHYFVAAAVNPGQTRVDYRSMTLPVPGESGKQKQYVAHSYRFAKAPSGVKFYIGPKSFDELKAVDGEFVRAINFGFWSFLSVPFLSALKWIDGYIGNYGWSIIALTVLINAVMFPLRHRSMVSMKKMQAIQPQLKAIQDRYKELKVTDPSRQKMNTEVMNLYREKGVNPASGCVPMILTFPILFAFYSMMSQAIELRGAPFALWIHDLSTPDPYFIFPLLMGVSMFVQTKMSPASVDPTQQRMMMIMPVMFVALFLRSPSGLAIYYLTSNLLLIAQQTITNRLIGSAAPAAPRPAAERRLKNVGSGRTEGAEKKT